MRAAAALVRACEEEEEGEEEEEECVSKTPLSKNSEKSVLQPNLCIKVSALP